jgi:hypothetical protein
MVLIFGGQGHQPESGTWSDLEPRQYSRLQNSLASATRHNASLGVYLAIYHYYTTTTLYHLIILINMSILSATHTLLNVVA